jgi:hypothetical protein
MNQNGTSILSPPQRDRGEPQQSKIIKDETSTPCGSRGLEFLTSQTTSHPNFFCSAISIMDSRISLLIFSVNGVIYLHIGANKTLKELVLQNRNHIAHRVIVGYRTRHAACSERRRGNRKVIPCGEAEISLQFSMPLFVGSFQSDVSTRKPEILPSKCTKHRLKFMRHRERKLTFLPLFSFFHSSIIAGGKSLSPQIGVIFIVCWVFRKRPFQW